MQNPVGDCCNALMMPMVLVCQRDALWRAETIDALARKMVVVSEAADTRIALKYLESSKIVLAVVDWQGDATKTLLRSLAAHREIPTIVFGRGVADANVVHQVGCCHPAAMIEDAVYGVGSLIGRITQLMTKRVGDLELRAGHVTHLSSGLRICGQAAPKLLSAYPNAVRLEKMPAYRVRRSLKERGSAVLVRGGRDGLYWLDDAHADAA